MTDKSISPCDFEKARWLMTEEQRQKADAFAGIKDPAKRAQACMNLLSGMLGNKYKNSAAAKGATSFPATSIPPAPHKQPPQGGKGR